MSIFRTAAETLVADLEQAELETDGWRDQAAGQALINLALDRSLATLAATGLWGRDNQIPSSEFWQVAGPILQHGSLHCRARFKPRGYAGDYETFVMFWECFTCDHPLGRLFDDYFQRQTAVEAVRSRTKAIARVIVEHAKEYDGRPYVVTSIGCGPAIDIALAVQKISGSDRDNLWIQLFDLDEEALNYAAQRLHPMLVPQQVTARRENLYRLAERWNSSEILKASDFIVCIGLFDYLPDDAAVRLLRFLWEQLNPGGVLMVGNFAPSNPSRAYMEWFGNWYLLYRTREQLTALSDKAGIPRVRIAVGAERTGVNLLLVATKNADRRS
jgi:extracellular factor (EF) 3-hydroxypalmitic acid methyl ester biosynthesis protein